MSSYRDSAKLSIVKPEEVMLIKCSVRLVDRRRGVGGSHFLELLSKVAFRKIQPYHHHKVKHER